MQLAVRKDVGGVPGGGFHYMLHPIAMGPHEGEIFALMGYHIIDVGPARGARLLAESVAALRSQIEVAYLVEGQHGKDR